MHLDTITEILNIPNYKVAEVIKSDPERNYMILERIEGTTQEPPSPWGLAARKKIATDRFLLSIDKKLSRSRFYVRFYSHPGCPLSNPQIVVRLQI